MIKYCCDMCKQEIENGQQIKTKLPLIQYVWVKDSRETKLTYMEHGIIDEEVELCITCYMKIGSAMESLGIKSKSWDG